LRIGRSGGQFTQQKQNQGRDEKDCEGEAKTFGACCSVPDAAE
jgi:hypothetical protein